MNTLPTLTGKVSFLVGNASRDWRLEQPCGQSGLRVRTTSGGHFVILALSQGAPDTDTDVCRHLDLPSSQVGVTHCPGEHCHWGKHDEVGRQNNGPPNMATFSSPEPVNTLPDMAAEISTCDSVEDLGTGGYPGLPGWEPVTTVGRSFIRRRRVGESLRRCGTEQRSE